MTIMKKTGNKKVDDSFFRMEIKVAIGFKKLSITDIVSKMNLKGYGKVRKHLDILIEEGSVIEVIINGHPKYKNGMI